MFLAAGTILDSKFEIRSVIGYGGMGVVYEAYQRGLDREVALKLLTAIDTPEDVARFEREANILSRVQHANIVQFYAYGTFAAVPYIVMERLHGQSLQAMLSDTKQIPLPAVLDMAYQVCGALEHAHRNEILHRDLKPSNIVLVQAGGGAVLAKVIDFGLAKLVCGDYQQKITRTGVAVGSVTYMSPEQCSAQKVDARSDIYALGGVLYHCITGEPAFAEDTAVALMFQQINEPVEATRGWKQIPAPLQQVIGKCMAKNPQDRYSSASALSADLALVKEERLPQLEGKAPKALSKRWQPTEFANCSQVKLLLVPLALAIGLCLFGLSRPQRTEPVPAPVLRASNTPFEVIRSNHFTNESFTDEEEPMLRAAIDAYKNERNIDRYTLAMGYARLMRYHFATENFKKVRLLGEECFRTTGLPDKKSLYRFIREYHDSCESANCELSIMPVLEESLRMYKDKIKVVERTSIEMRLAGDYLQVGRRADGERLLEHAAIAGISKEELGRFEDLIRRYKLKPLKPLVEVEVIE